MNTGYFLVYRRLFEHEIGQNPLVVALWVRLLADASYEDKEVWFDGSVIKIKRGQLITSIKKLSKWLHTAQGTTKRHLNALQKIGQIEIKTTNKYTVITIQNYNKYQVNREQTENKLRTNREQNETTKEIKEYKETNKYIYIDKSIVKTYGNPQINELLGYMKEKLNLELLDDSDKRNRQYAHLCMKKFGFDKTKLAIDASAESKFWHTKITSFKSLYYNAIQIVSSLRGEVKSVDATKILVSKNERREGVFVVGGGIRAIEGSVS